MTARALQFVVPGDIHSASGGYVYDRMMIAGLRGLGWRVAVHGLDASFPYPSTEATAHAAHVFARLPAQACVLVDGLALGAMPQIIEAHSRRLHVVALIHMPLACEFGIAPAVAEHLRAQEQRALRLVRHVIVSSRGTERALTSCGIEPACVTVVEPGVQNIQIPDRSRVRALDNGVEMLCVATVQAGKGHELLIDALAPLAYLPWRLRCVGSLSRSPAVVERVAERLDRLGLGDRIELIGDLPHEALSELYLAADLFVLPTLRETYCLAVAEALAHGLPVVSSRTGAIPELVGTEAGLLIEPGDGDGLRAALERALSDGALRDSMRAAALGVRARLTPWPSACERLARVLERVCDLQNAVNRA